MYREAGVTDALLDPVSRRFSRERIFLRARRVVKSVCKHTVLIAVAMTCVFPLVWMFSSALKTQASVNTDMSLFPAHPQWINFVTAWTKANFGTYFFNSVLYTGVCVVAVLAISSLAAYAFARLQFRGKTFFYYMFLATMLIPVPAAIVALYVLIRNLGLIDTRLGYMLPQINGQLALGIFLLKPFFERIPKDLEDAARIDGCGRFGIFWNVALPLARPAMAVVALFTALAVWNEFILASLVLQTNSLMPLQLGLVKFWGGALSQDHLLTAGMTIVVFPIVIAYVFLQRHIIAGVTAGALKG